jgi:hypothetical protein
VSSLRRPAATRLHGGVVRRSITVALLLGVTLAGAMPFGGATVAAAAGAPHGAAAASWPQGVDDVTPPVSNDFIPSDEDLTDCVGLVERPNCGSSDKGGWRTYLAFAILMAGMAFIGWRISRAVRARDELLNANANGGGIAATSAAIGGKSGQ